MPKTKHARESIIEKFKSIHRDKFDYSLVDYIDFKTNVQIICNKCGNSFWQTPNSHLRYKHNCPKCAVIMRAKMQTKSLEQFIIDACKIHGNKFDYSLVDYINTRTKVKIRCNRCKIILEIAPNTHLSQRCGCAICYGNKKKTTEEFIKEARKIHGDKFDYSESNYINTKTKVKIKCNRCDTVFEQTPNNHIGSKSGCLICAIIDKTLTFDQFIDQARKIHGDKYGYGLVEYKNMETKVSIKCNKCENIFSQRPKSHFQNNGCPCCNQSKGESIIDQFFKNRNIVIRRQEKFEGCKNEKLLRFDFYIPSHNLLIEYQGEQHFKQVSGKWQDTNEKFKDRQKRDKIKRDWAITNSYNFVEIRYDEDIEEKLKRLFN